MIQTPFLFGNIPHWTPPALPELSRHTEVTVDCETDGLDWYRGARPVGAAVRLPATGETYYIPWAHAGGQNLDPALVRTWMQQELKGKRVRNMNTRFDVHMLREWGVDLIEMGCTFHDVAHSAALLDDHRRKFDLETLAQDYLGEGKLASGRKSEIAGLSASAVAAYAIQDVTLVDRLYDHFAPLLDEMVHGQNLRRVSALEDSVIPVVIEMEKNGCPINEDKLRTWIKRTASLLEQRLWDISREAGFVINPDRNTDLMRVFKHLGISNPNRTNTGAVSFPSAYMRTIDHPLIKKIVEAGKLVDLRSKYLLPYAKLAVNGTLFGSYHQLRTGEGGTVSGRFSASHPNLQQVMTPKKQKREYGTFDGESFLVKELFTPRPGHTWFCADQAAVEFRIAMHYAKAQRIIDAFKDDPKTDPHEAVATMIRVSNPSMTRDQAKNCNYAITYGAGMAKRAEMMGVSVPEAVAISAIFDKEFPELKAAADRAKYTAETLGVIRTLLGRRSTFPGGERSHKAFNAAVQGGSADINKLTLVEVYKERKRLGLVMQATVHDELDASLADGAPMQAVMDVLNAQYVPLSVPIIWDGGTGANWSEAK